MDQTSIDRKYLSEKKCPDCQQPIKKYFLTSDKPMCEKCDIWFNIQDNGWVIRNNNAKELYDKTIKKLQDSLEIDVEVVI